ncbi:MAG: alpha/beta-hydrolase family protein [Pseudomonadota bacterium]
MLATRALRSETLGRVAGFLGRRLRPSIPGLVVATAAFCASLTPSLIPREPLFQGLISGVVAALGYELGNVLALIWRFLELPHGRPKHDAAIRAVAYTGAAAAVTYCVFRASDWQNAVRDVAGMAPVDTSHPLQLFSVSAAIMLTLWLLFRLFGLLFDRIKVALSRVMPPRVSFLFAMGTTVWFVWAVADGVLVNRLLQAADGFFEAADEMISPDLARPENPLLSGSPDSLIAWRQMGRWGRAFVASRPSMQELRAFDPDAIEPIRIYIGRNSAETSQGRADLALAELQRVGAFERSALLIATPVGTGYMDHYAQDTLEFIRGGDIATVGVQYSYMTSALALMVHPEYGLEQSQALFQTIYDYWVDLPEADRPELYVFGLSQGAYNSQATMPVLDLLADPISGGVWAGSPFLSPIWRTVRDDRVPASPAWRPVFGNSTLIRSMNQAGTGPLGDPPWGPMRFVFLQYGSDPIVNFTFTSAFRRPAWMAFPRAPDVAPEFRWFPLVTTLQLGLDMATSQQIEGFGHEYAAKDYITAWVAVAAPPDWTEAQTRRLQAIFARRPPAY